MPDNENFEIRWEIDQISLLREKYLLSTIHRYMDIPWRVYITIYAYIFLYHMSSEERQSPVTQYPFRINFVYCRRLIVRVENSFRTQYRSHLGVYLCCNYDSICEQWSCEHKTKVMLFNRNLEKNITLSV